MLRDEAPVENQVSVWVFLPLIARLVLGLVKFREFGLLDLHFEGPILLEVSLELLRVHLVVFVLSVV